MAVERIDIAQLVHALGDGEELALLDAREQGAYSEAHLLYAANLPRSRAELVASRLIPRRSTRVVVIDAGDGEAESVATTLVDRGYADVSVVVGGLGAWADAGHEVYSGVNVPSKLFGELVERHYGTPHVSAVELDRWLDEGRRMVVLDSRTEREFNRMSIPAGQSCPGGELVHRVFDLIDDDVTVVVNCAGRTRSIMGAQSLRSAGLANEVVALENGTMGWELVGLQLEHGRTEVAPEPSDAGRAAAGAAAQQVADRVGVPTVDRATADGWMADSSRTTHLLDVRTPAEFVDGHLPRSTSAPGGQLVQATDEYVATRGARLVLVDDDGTRATMTASWLIQMGWDAFVLPGVREHRDLATGDVPLEVDLPEVPLTDSFAGSLIVDLATSTEHRRGHIPGAVWAVRGRLAALAADRAAASVVLTSPDGVVATLAHAEASAAWPDAEVAVLSGGTTTFVENGGDLEAGLDVDGTPDDVWQLPYDPGDAEVARAAMEGYLVWEVALVEQYDRDPLAHFPLTPLA